MWRWYLSISRKLFRVATGTTFAILVSTLLSQLAVLLAFLLPLKVIILVSTSGFPRFFPDFLRQYERDSLILSLCVISVSLYFVHLLAEKIIELLTHRGSELLLANSGKLILLSNQKKLLGQQYQRYSRSLASAVFITLAMLAIGLMYRDLFWLILGYTAVVVSASIALFKISRRWSERVRGRPGPYINFFSSVGFLLIFAFMVYQFLYASPPTVLIAIIALILCRQIKSRLAISVSDLRGLRRNQTTFNALIFHAHYQPDRGQSISSLTELITDNELRTGLLNETLVSFLPEAVLEKDIAWFQLGGLKVVGFELTCRDQAGAAKRRLLVKVFDQKLTAEAVNEEMLMKQMPRLPALPFIGAVSVQSYHCHLFELPRIARIKPRQFKKDLLSLLIESMARVPDKALVSRYRRSHPMIWQRMDGDLINRLNRIASMIDPALRQEVENFGQAMESVRRILKAMPLSVVNANLKMENLFYDERECIGAIDWARWSIEPVGAGWPLKKHARAQLSEAFEALCSKRGGLQEISQHEFFLAALVHRLYLLYRRGNYSQACQLVPEINRCVDIIRGRLPEAS